ncbi:energy transducer TonB [Spirosoma endbachense]|uniref:TonB family protein n=1 Tax=Spirosoma endbachense TaxID=2666025 RepID=A0A6P1VYA6_9BACT|nr:energy transducer TonB [Spirosoma endbachense]QHV97062.1 TonB family protein [Spirosoma endbachense]
MLQSDTPALTLDEIIFQTRNRAYGAFDLRLHYRSALTRALGFGIGLFLLGLSAPTLYNQFWPHNLLVDKPVMTEVTLTKLAEPPVEQPLKIPPLEQAPAVKTVRNLPPVVMPEEEVIVETLPPTTEQFQDATSGTQTAEGTGDVDIIAAPEVTAPTVVEKAIEAEPKPDELFISVEQNPEYPGGLEAMRKFLSKNLSYPRPAASAGVSGRVYVSFVVNSDGSLTDVQVLKGIGFGCDEEATRVIQKMPHWKPGKQSGRAVRVKFNLPISFTLE